MGEHHGLDAFAPPHRRAGAEVCIVAVERALDTVDAQQEEEQETENRDEEAGQEPGAEQGERAGAAAAAHAPRAEKGSGQMTKAIKGIRSEVCQKLS